MSFQQKKGVSMLLKESIARGLFLGAFFALLGIGSAFVLQAPYRSSTDFMISSAQNGQDYYTATRSAEYMSRVLSEVVYSESFINTILETGDIDSNFLPKDKKDRLKQWAQMLSVNKNPELGFIKVVISGSSEREVSRISQAMTIVLTEKSGEFFGNGNEAVNVKLLSGPIIEANPSGSLLSFIAIAGFLLGYFCIFTLRLVREEFHQERIVG